MLLAESNVHPHFHQGFHLWHQDPLTMDVVLMQGGEGAAAGRPRADHASLGLHGNRQGASVEQTSAMKQQNIVQTGRHLYNGTASQPHVVPNEGDSQTITAGTLNNPLPSALKTSPQHGSTQPNQVTPPRDPPVQQSKTSNMRKQKASTREEKSPYVRMSPMARMRNVSEQQKQPSDEPRVSFLDPFCKTTEQMKAEKQRRWRSKLKQAQERKRAERRALDASNNCSAETFGGNAFATMVGATVLDLIGKCGVIDDIPSDSDSSGDDDSGGDENSQESGESSDSGDKVKTKRKVSLGRSTMDVDGSSPARVSFATNTSTPERMQTGDSEPIQVTPDRSTTSPMETSSPGTFFTGDTPIMSGYNAGKAYTTPPRSFQADGGMTSVSPLYPHIYETSATIDPNSMNFVKAFVHDLTTIGCPLLWHKEIGSMTAVPVQLRLERGYLSHKGTYCAPSLVWDENDFDAYGIDLFDIRVLDRANSALLLDYPYTMPRRTITLQTTRGHDFVFEGKTENEINRFLHGMRWLIARLAFNLAIGNIDVGSELLDITYLDDEVQQGPLEEFRQAKAMDDLTDLLVDRSMFDNIQV